MDLQKKKQISKELYKVLISSGKIESAKLSKKNLTKALNNYGKIQLIKLKMKNQISNLTMSLLVLFSLKDIIKTKVKEFSLTISTKMITCLQTFLLLIPKRKCQKKDHKKDLMITQGMMKKHQEEMTFIKTPKKKLLKRKVRIRK